MKKRCFIGDFVNNETIEQIFKVMSSNEKFTYTIKGNIIDVY
ncbi:FecR domain-containing protein [Barnesiella intestinihominis]